MKRQPPRPATILIVDDNADVREMYAEYLQFVGFVIATAVDGEDALDKVRANPPDVLVVDLTIPGMNGWAVATAVKADVRTSAVRIIAVTGHALRWSADASNAGIDAFLIKPCLPEALAAEIAVQLRERGR